MAQVTIRYFDGCPHWRVARERVIQAMKELCLSTDDIVYEILDTDEAARREGFRGSPTVLIDGLDPFFDGSADIGLACRLYHTPAGLEGAPSVDQLKGAIGSL